MRITFIKENRDAGTESISTCDTAAFITRIKSETKPGHVSALRDQRNNLRDFIFKHII